MAVVFHKMHGLSNDFILLDLRQQNFPLNADVVKRLANRRSGVGCDQLLVLRKPENEQYLAAFEIWNSDGTRAEQCGNGVRCLGLYLKMNSETPDGQFLLSGPAGKVKIEYLGDSQLRVDMGSPVFKPEKIPLLEDPVDGWYSLLIDKKRINLGAVSMGNPHALVVVEDLSATDVKTLGSAINRHPAFPEGCNVGFAQIINRDQIRLRVYERGAAETFACGSGACAAAVILGKADMVNQAVDVTQAGGSLIISWTGEDNPVIMTGLASYVFEGNIA